MKDRILTYRRVRVIAGAAGLVVASASMALAQFPPPGVYACADASGANFGTLTLLVAGDYAFAAPNGSSGTGQVASAANEVTPLTGPLKDMGLSGAFGTDEAGHTLFKFTAAGGAEITCSEAPA
jgi:hypothetical protein